MLISGNSVLEVHSVGPVPFSPAADIRFLPSRVLPYHVNGMTILGMVIFSVRVTHKNVWWLFDRMISGVAALCFCIRFGNLMNSEIYGFPTTMPWGFEFVRSREWHQLYEGLPCHPTQIYEMIYCLVAGLTAWIMYRKYRLQRYVGLITGVSLLIFFGARFGLEF